MGRWLLHCLHTTRNTSLATWPGTPSTWHAGQPGMARLARQYAPKHIGLNEKNKYKIFHTAGWNSPTVLRGPGFFSPGLPKKLLHILSVPSMAQRASGKPAAFRPSKTLCGATRPVFQTKIGRGHKAAAARNCRHMGDQDRAARAQARALSIIGLDEPPGQVHSVSACRFQNPAHSEPGAKGLKKILKLCPTRCILRQSLMRL